MARYDTEFTLLMERTAAEGVVDLGTWIKRKMAHGVSGHAILEDLMHDLDNGGPIFGKFFRSMGGAAASSVMTAARQGEIVGYVADSAVLRNLLEREGLDGPQLQRTIDDADPEIAQRIEETVADQVMETWVCTLRRTCPRCLPLHGKTMSHAEWLAAGYSPDTIHDGWDSPCYCRLVPAEHAPKDVMAPLVRTKADTGTGRTKRSILATDVDRAVAAARAASLTPEGKRLLSRLGHSNLE